MGGMFIHWRSFIVGVDIGMGRVKHFRDPNIKAFSMEELAMSWNAGVDFSIFKYSDFVLTLLWTSFHLWNSYHATTSSSSSAKSRAACTKIWGRQCILLACTIVRAVTKICFNEIAIYDWCVDRNHSTHGANENLVIRMQWTKYKIKHMCYWEMGQFS